MCSQKLFVLFQTAVTQVCPILLNLKHCYLLIQYAKRWCNHRFRKYISTSVFCPIFTFYCLRKQKKTNIFSTHSPSVTIVFCKITKLPQITGYGQDIWYKGLYSGHTKPYFKSFKIEDVVLATVLSFNLKHNKIDKKVLITILPVMVITKPLYIVKKCNRILIW